MIYYRITFEFVSLQGRKEGTDSFLRRCLRARRNGWRETVTSAFARTRIITMTGRTHGVLIILLSLCVLHEPADATQRRYKGKGGGSRGKGRGSGSGKSPSSPGEHSFETVDCPKASAASCMRVCVSRATRSSR